MKSTKYIFTIICMSLAILSRGQGKVGHFDRKFMLLKLAENEQVLKRAKKSVLDSASDALKLAVSVTQVDSATADSIFFKVVKRGGYQYVFNTDYLLAASANSNLAPLVLKQLRIVMPDSNTCDLFTAKRFAYCNRDSVLAQMPEARAAERLLVVFRNDSLSMEYDNLLAEFQRYDSCLKIDHGCFTSTLFNKEDITRCFEKLQNWLNYSEKRVQEKKSELLNACYGEINNAIKRLAGKEGYDYIFKDNFHYQGVKNISTDVVKELASVNM